MRCCLQRVLPYSHTSRAQTSWPGSTNPIPPAAEIYLPSKRMAGVNTKEHRLTLCACLSLHPKLLLSLPNAAASHADCKGSCGCFKNGIPYSPLCKCFGKNCTNPFTDDTRVDDEEDNDITERRRIASALLLWG